MDFVDQLKSQVNIVNVIGQYVQLKKASRDRYVGLCPFHKEKSGSFSVSETKQFYHCFGCHVSGDVLKFVQAIEGVSFYVALNRLEDPRRLDADARIGAGTISRQPTWVRRRNRTGLSRQARSER
jgi:DNA primase